MIAFFSRNLASSLFALTASAALLVGCSGDDTSENTDSATTTASTTGTSTTGATETTTDTSGSTSDGTGSTTAVDTETSGGAVCGDGKQDPGEECDDGNNEDQDGCSAECLTEGTIMCDVLEQDCPDGMKCAPTNSEMGAYWDQNTCIPINGNGLFGDPCDVVEGQELGSGIDTCDLGFFCFGFDGDGKDGSCFALCEGDTKVCQGDQVCINANGGALPICLDGCDPLVQDCSDGQACYASTDDAAFICSPYDAEGMDNDNCSYDNACLPGLWCMAPELVDGCDQGNDGCCNPYCDINDGSECSENEVCVAIFDEPQKSEWADAGACVLP
ncbi:MAG: hypothetical protein R3A79_29135 [Nannocystaceae bacterium]